MPSRYLDIDLLVCWYRIRWVGRLAGTPLLEVYGFNRRGDPTTCRPGCRKGVTETKAFLMCGKVNETGIEAHTPGCPIHFLMSYLISVENDPLAWIVIHTKNSSTWPCLSFPAVSTCLWIGPYFYAKPKKPNYLQQPALFLAVAVTYF